MAHMGKKIKEYRKLKGLTQRQLAELLKINQQNVSYYEQCEIVPVKKLREIASALGVFPHVFYEDDYLLRDLTPLTAMLKRLSFRVVDLSGLVQLAMDKNESSISVISNNDYIEIQLDELMSILTQAYDLYNYLLHKKGIHKGFVVDD